MHIRTVQGWAHFVGFILEDCPGHIQVQYLPSQNGEKPESSYLAYCVVSIEVFKKGESQTKAVYNQAEDVISFLSLTRKVFPQTSPPTLLSVWKGNIFFQKALTEISFGSQTSGLMLMDF